MSTKGYALTNSDGTINASDASLDANVATFKQLNDAIDNITEDNLTLSDVSTNNADTSKHGFLPKLANVATQFLNAQGNWATPAGLSVVNSYSIVPFTASATTTVTHNFGTYPVVQVINASGVLVAPTSVTHNSINDFTVVIGGSFDGNILATLGSPPLKRMVSVSADYTITTSDEFITVTAIGKTITLPTAVGVSGKTYAIDNDSVGDIILDTTSSQTIQNELEQIIPTQSCITVFSNGANWRIN